MNKTSQATWVFPAISVEQRLDWTDIFWGDALRQSQRRCSFLDPTVKVALHYLPEDLPTFQGSRPPHPQIPLNLWQQLVKRSQAHR
ncbi:MAG: hypothetical protein NW237_16660 [Cyanobacteriota bacterium]|nr:hypothetical protein [Cyanobacteriota bacterium]